MANENWEVLINLQEDYYYQVQKVEVNFKKEGKKRTIQSAKNRLQALEEIWTNFKTNHKHILSQATEELRETKYFTEDLYDQTSEVYIEIKGHIQEAIFLLTPSTSVNPPTISTNELNNNEDILRRLLANTQNQNEIRLPPIKIPIFEGNYNSWAPFYDLFKTMVHDKVSLSGVQKFHYLKSQLLGEAKILIDQLQITDANYNTAWEMLVNRYQNTRLLVHSHIDTLMNQHKITHESSSEIKRILDKTRECINSISNLGIDTTTWDPIIVYIVTQRLDSESNRLYEQSLANPKEVSTWEELNNFLETRFQSLEMIQHSSSNKLNKNHNIHRQGNHHIYATNNQQPTAYKRTINSSPKCSYCNSFEHSTFKCNQFDQMTPQSRLKWAQQASLCTNCLRTGHNSYNCTSRNRCSTCNKNHHSLLHIQKSSNTIANCNILQYESKHNISNNISNAQHQQHTYYRNPTNPFSQSPSYQTTPISTYANRPSQTAATNASPVSRHSSSQKSSNIQSHCINSHLQSHTVLLATALVNVPDRYGIMHAFRALIDQGSEISFITESAVQTLQIPKTSTTVSISGICNMQQKTNKATSFQLRSRVNPNFATQIDAIIVSKITNFTPNRITPSGWKHIENIELADPKFNQPGSIDILLGAEIYSEIIMEGLKKYNDETPIAQQTTLGWILTGKTQRSQQENSPSSFHLHTEESIDQQLQKFWKIEEPANINIFTTEEQLCEDIYEETTYRNHDGTYTVSLPFNPTKHTELGNSRKRAVARLLSMEKNFTKNPELRKQYIEFINEYIRLNHAEIVRPLTETDNAHYFMPHQAVIREESTTTKLRVVFDASSKSSSGVSLNDQILSGPTIQKDLYSIILKWRTHKIAVTADIEKMYRQIHINPKNYNHQRIVWRENPEEPIQDIILKTVTYGTSSAPYLAIKTLQTLAKDDEKFFQTASRVLQTDFYVDDLMTGGESEEDVISLKDDLCELLQRGGFKLRKWTSNSIRVLETISQENREMQLPLDINPKETYKTLGIQWNPVTDQFHFSLKIQPETVKTTKRSILSLAAKLFDPQGWIAPVVITFKILIQKLWLAGVSWDENIPESIQSEWLSIIKDLPNLKTILIPRWYPNFYRTSKIELHGFCDASSQAYAAVIYMRITDASGNISTSIVASKTRVAPLKMLSIPRLELCGAVLLTQLVLKSIEGIELKNPAVSLWSDSTIVLAWIRNDPRKYKSFVANRLAEIQNTQFSSCWQYVSTSENPADCATRGVMPSKLHTHPLWWNGPPWLSQEKSTWIKQEKHEEKPNIDSEIQSHHIARQANLTDIIENYSSLTKLKRVIAYVLRFIYNMKRQTKKHEATSAVTDCRLHQNPHNEIGARLSAVEIKFANNVLLKGTQESEFWTEIQCLRDKKDLPKTSKILSLNPFLDENQILRVGGRLTNSNIAYETKFPIILPSNQPYTSLLIKYAHIQALHGGAQLTLAITRNEYWIINGRSTVRRELFKCVRCHRFKKDTHLQIMGNLPSPRATLSRPFTHVGVDFAGPINLRMSKGRGNKTYKGYISLFVCLCTKAIHLEAVSDLTSESFIAALRRFFGRRGLSSHIYSDNATNFVGADRLLRAERRKYIASFESDVSAATATEGVQWHFIPPAAPNFGGLWEAGVKSVKSHLKKILGETTLSFEEFNTTLIQIEACINSRPLYPLTEDPDDLEVLTPGHFLTGSALLSYPQNDVSDKNLSSMKRWDLTTKLYQQFWKRWYTDYLNTLQQRPKKYSQAKIQPKVNDVVILKEDNMPPTKWNLGRIVTIHPGTDDVTRVVTVKTAKGLFKRPTSKISILPINDNAN